MEHASDVLESGCVLYNTKMFIESDHTPVQSTWLPLHSVIFAICLFSTDKDSILRTFDGGAYTKMNASLLPDFKAAPLLMGMIQPLDSFLLFLAKAD